MVTIKNIGNAVSDPRFMEIYGLSTDTKPTKELEGHTIINASIYYEMDTKVVYLYDEENARWLEQ